MQDNEKKVAVSRRAFVGKMATGAAGAAVALAAAGRAQALVPQRQSSAGRALPDIGTPPARESLPQAASVESPAAVEAVTAPQAAQATEPSAPPPWEMLRPLALGASVGEGWKIADLSEIQHGACVLTLQNRRRRTQRIHLCRNDGRPQGLVYTDRFDLVVMNGGQGDLPTEEDFGQAVAAVAHVLAANEKRSQHRQTVAAVMPQSERLQKYADTSSLR